MTCIAGIEHDGKVWIAGDSAASSDSYSAVRTSVSVVTRMASTIALGSPASAPGQSQSTIDPRTVVVEPLDKAVIREDDDGLFVEARARIVPVPWISR